MDARCYFGKFQHICHSGDIGGCFCRCPDADLSPGIPYRLRGGFAIVLVGPGVSSGILAQEKNGQKEIEPKEASVSHQIILGTAGHIDHGKTTLIKALTGTNTGPLKESSAGGSPSSSGSRPLTCPAAGTWALSTFPATKSSSRTWWPGRRASTSWPW